MEQKVKYLALSIVVIVLETRSFCDIYHGLDKIRLYIVT